MSTLNTQSTTPATIPAGTQIAADQVGTPNAPTTGDRLQYVKLDVGAAGVSAPVTTGNPLPITALPASNSFGQAVATTAGSTATLVNLNAAAGYRITGLIGSGTGDGLFFVQVAGATVFSGRTRATLPTLDLTLPNGIVVATGAAVVLKVTNESGSTADFDGTLLGV